MDRAAGPQPVGHAGGDVEIALRAQLVEGSKEQQIAEVVGTGLDGRRQTGQHDPRVGVRGADGLPHVAQHGQVFGGVRRASAPLAKQVGLVPYLVVPDLAAIARRQLPGEVGEVRVVGWRRLHPRVGPRIEARRGPGGSAVQSRQNLDSRVPRRLHDVVVLDPGVPTDVRVLLWIQRLEFRPVELLANQPNARPAQHLKLLPDFRRIRLAVQKRVRADGGRLGMADFAQGRRAVGHAVIEQSSQPHRPGGDDDRHRDGRQQKPAAPRTQ